MPRPGRGDSPDKLGDVLGILAAILLAAALWALVGQSLIVVRH